MNKQLPRRKQMMPVGPAALANRLGSVVARLDPAARDVALGLPVAESLL